MKMRITGGNLTGRKINVPSKGVRPTQDRVRESLFSTILSVLPGASVLDVYAGSGALGLEAWSRGAVSVTWVERNRNTYKLLKRNVESLCGDMQACRCVHSDAPEFVAKSTPASFDLIFADPPYDKNNSSRAFECLLRTVDRARALVECGILVYEMSTRESFDLPGTWTVLRDKKWGETRVLILT